MLNLSRRTFLERAVRAAEIAIVASVTPVQAQKPSGRGVPISGGDQPELASFDELMARFVKEQRVPGAALAITKESRLVYARGFGLADREHEQAVQPTDLFRIASVSKAITAVAILQLVERDKLNLNAKVWDLLTLSQPSDPRWMHITVLHLLRH